MYGPKKIPT